MRAVSFLMKYLLACTVGIALLGPVARVPAEHYHLNVGALSQTQNTPLFFSNAGDFITNSGFVLPLPYTNSGDYAGFHQSGSFSPVAIAAFLFVNPASLGTQVRLRFVSVTGPAGGSLGVWDVPGFNYDEDEATALTFNLPVGTTNGTQTILLSQNNGQPGANPGGHIHGRHFSATKSGLYVVTIQAYDASTNGTGGGPIHLPSDPLPIYFQAGDTIASVGWEVGQVNLTFATRIGSDYFVQATTNLVATNTWQTIAGPLTGNDHLQTVSDTNWNATQRFYRLQLVPSPDP